MFVNMRAMGTNKAAIALILALVGPFSLVSPVFAQVQPAERLSGVAGHTNSLTYGPLEIASLVGIPLALIAVFLLVGREGKS
jgi:hypothetical protein